ncbi:MAG: efflux RND transporter periplasmic adaptor subunit [Hydrococcus sp. C42_A2020_068]|uniref:efflux RND transporter periplasmic adaptor subunit n=1 Tax=Pleurocapsa sp. PCC 7327 TaxID=118163 RepID=UPI00029FA771|nr:efflux RND transporter periplasmic adaptor subunit [Pleurocapsa sp. PCC 7327]AFY77788.1 RND family efflux transporter, MFP subunit [Pleurocapsa sp. PCC 7327]MBF2021446.1 efflux RND transporter periplasmic adaptor subunit [Hydrococcus sp. C42_A2020_068]
MKYLPQKLVYLIAGLGIATLVVFSFRPAPIRIDMATVKRGSLQVTVDSEGETRIRNRYVVSAPVAGRLARLNLKEGYKVNKGALIAQIDPLPLTAQVRESQARLREWQAERAGVATLRPKAAALAQAQARIRAAVAAERVAEAKVRQIEATLAQAKRDRDRAQQLHAQGAISRQEFENAELLEISRAKELEAAKREVDSAAAEVAAAQKELSILQAEQRDPDYLLDVYDARIASVRAELEKLADEAKRTEIRAPVDGYVLRVLQESARYVEAGTPLLEIGNPKDLEIVVDLLSSDAVNVKPGATMLIEHWGGEQALKAKVRYVEPSAFTKVSALGVEEQRVNVIADFVNPSIPLSDGYRVETRTVVWEGKNVLIVPLSALFRCDRQQNGSDSKAWCTFIVENNRARKREIEISQRSSFEAAIKRGLQVGEKVILHPTEQIQEGQRVESQ